MKAIVTGGTGFIGSHVVEQLIDEGHKVRILSRKGSIPETLRGKDVEIMQGDLEDFNSVVNAMDGIDVFYHIGEIRNINKAASEKNCKLMELILENLEKKGCKRLVFISSITVSGIPSHIPANEDTTPEVLLQDHYTSYKRTCEKLIVDKPTGCEYVIIRPAPVYGPRSRYLGRLLNALENIGPFGFPFIGNGKNNAPLIYVKDLARAIYLSGLKPSASGQVFILTDGLYHSWFEFFNTIAELLGKKLRMISIPPVLLKIPAMPLDLFSGFFDIELDPVHYMTYFSRDIYFENSRAINLLKWKPEYNMTDGIKEMIKYYRGDSLK